MYYRLYVVYNGYCPEMDKKIRKLVGREDVGAGFGFGERDMSFEFKQKPALIKACKNLRKNKILFTATSYINDDDWDGKELDI